MKDEFIGENKKVYIYALTEPEDKNEIRYIGKTVNPRKRLTSHINEAGRIDGIGNYKYIDHKNNWIRKILKENKRPQMVVLYYCYGIQWAKEEQLTIALCKELGYRLTNVSNGGDGSPWCQHTPETIEKIRLAHLGKPRSEETIKKIIETKNNISEELKKETSMKMKESSKKRWQRNDIKDETRKKLSENHREHNTLETNKKISLSNKGRKKTPEQIERQSKALKGIEPWNKGKINIYSEESLEKMRIARLGKKHSKETIRKIKNNRKPYTEEQRMAASERMKGFKLSEESKRKISEKNIGRIVLEETKEKIRMANIGKKASEETKKKMSQSHKGNKGTLGNKQSPETIAKRIAHIIGKPSWSAGLKLGPLSQEHKDKISKANKGKIMTEEHKMAMRKPKTSKLTGLPIKKSKETKERIKEIKNRIYTEQICAKLFTPITSMDEDKEYLQELKDKLVNLQVEAR